MVIAHDFDFGPRIVAQKKGGEHMDMTRRPFHMILAEIYPILVWLLGFFLMVSQPISQTHIGRAPAGSQITEVSR